jgi:hypothetical protein
MGWWGYGIYDGDETQTLHFYFLKWAKVSKDFDELQDYLDSKATILPKDKVGLLKKNSGLILKKMKKRKFWDEYQALSWQMLLALYLDNKVIPPKTIIKNGIEATNYLIEKCSDDYDNPSARKRVLRNFIKKAEDLTKKKVKK